MAALGTVWRIVRSVAAGVAGAARWTFSGLRKGLARLRRKALNPTPPPVAVALDHSSPPLESIYQQIVGQSARIVGVTGVEHDNGVSTIARAIAQRACSGGIRALLVDASFTSPAEVPAEAPRISDDGYHTVNLRPTGADVLLMRDLGRLRKTFADWLSDFDMVIVDMVPPLPDPKYPLPATVVARACDAALVVCLTGKVTQSDLKLALTALREASAPLLGLIVNHREQPTLGAEIAREAERLRKLAPRRVARVQARVSESKFLNVHA